MVSFIPPTVPNLEEFLNSKVWNTHKVKDYELTVLGADVGFIS